MSYIGTQPTQLTLETRQEFTASNLQTTFDTNPYTVGYVDCYLNGVKLSTSDFTANNGYQVVLGTGASANDLLAVVMKKPDYYPLPITDSAGNNVLSESGGVVTLTADAAVIEGSSSGDLVRITQTGSGNALVVEDSANPDSTPFVVNASGNVGVGTSSPTQRLQVDGGAFRVTGNYGSIANNQGLLLGFNGASSEARYYAVGANGGGVAEHVFYAFDYSTGAGSERMRIDSIGNVNISNLSASSDVQTDASKNLITTSDARLKNEIGLITESGIEVIKQIIPKYFSWKNDENNNQQLGFFAQDIYPVLPEAAPRVLKYTEVGRDENDDPILEQVFDEDGNPDYEWGFTDRPIIAMCVKAIQEQQTLIESQQFQIDALTARIEALETPAE